MTLPRLRDLCMSMPAATEQIQWGKDLVFKVGGKMFCVANTDPTGSEVAMSFKCDPETFAELCEREGIKPAPYMARMQWVGLERFDTLPDREVKPLVTRAYEIIRAKLPKKTQAALRTENTKDTKENTKGTKENTKDTKATKGTRNTKGTKKKKGTKGTKENTKRTKKTTATETASRRKYA